MDFVSAYKKGGLKEAGKLLMEVLQVSQRPQVKEEAGPGKSRTRKGKPSQELPASLAQARKEEIRATARTLDAKLKEAPELAHELMATVEGKVLNSLFEGGCLRHGLFFTKRSPHRIRGNPTLTVRRCYGAVRNHA